MEYVPDDEPPPSELLKQPLRAQKGYLPLPTQPGLGIELRKGVQEVPAQAVASKFRASRGWVGGVYLTSRRRNPR